MNPPQIEWCNFKKSSNLLFSMIIDLIKDSASELLQECPYFGRFEIRNMTLNVNKFLSVFSQGDYRVNVYFAEDKTDILKLIFNINVKSPIKSSFG